MVKLKFGSTLQLVQFAEHQQMKQICSFEVPILNILETFAINPTLMKTK